MPKVVQTTFPEFGLAPTTTGEKPRLAKRSGCSTLRVAADRAPHGIFKVFYLKGIGNFAQKKKNLCILSPGTLTQDLQERTLTDDTDF